MHLLFKQEDFFLLVRNYLKEKTSEDDAYLLLNWLQKIAGEFKTSEIVEAKNFQYFWLDIKELVKNRILTNDFSKYSDCLERKLLEIVEPELYETQQLARKEGDVLDLIDRATEALS